MSAQLLICKKIIFLPMPRASRDSHGSLARSQCQDPLAVLKYSL